MSHQQVRTVYHREIEYAINEFYRNASDLKELIRVCIDMVFWNSLIVHHLNQDSIFMSWNILYLPWYFLGILWLRIILVKTVFSCLDCILSWSRGYFPVLIRTVFSYVINIESTEDFQQDLNWTWHLFGQMEWITMIDYCIWLYLLYYEQMRWIVCLWIGYFLWSSSDLHWLLILHTWCQVMIRLAISMILFLGNLNWVRI